MTPVRTYRWLFLTMALFGLAADQISKYWVFSSLYEEGLGGNLVVVDNILTFEVEYLPPHLSDTGAGLLHHLRTISAPTMPAVNHGALWGQKLGFDASTANYLFSGVSFLAALAILIWSLTPRSARDGLLCFALGLIFAGALGNGYDRLVFNGVRDFLRFHPFDPPALWITGNHFPIFNVADCCLVVGAIILVFQALFLQPKEDKTPEKVEVTGERLSSSPAAASQTPNAEPVTSE